jgi:hypothetical protein
MPVTPIILALAGKRILDGSLTRLFTVNLRRKR